MHLRIPNSFTKDEKILPVSANAFDMSFSSRINGLDFYSHILLPFEITSLLEESVTSI